MTTLPVFWLVILLFGAAVGSFLNVVILRTQQHRSFIRGRSHCPHCNATLSWWELLPVVSFAIQRGKCRHCSKRLSYQYLIVELLTAAAFLTVWNTFTTVDAVLLGWVIASAMILIGIYDARWSVIPDAFTIVLAIGGFGLMLVSPISLFDSLLGGLFGATFFLLQFIISKRQWVGSGDILLGAALGLLLGWRMLGLGLMLAYFLGSIVAAGLLLFRKKNQNSAIAFGPYLVIGGFLAWIWGEALVDLYFNHAIFK